VGLLHRAGNSFIEREGTVEKNTFFSKSQAVDLNSLQTEANRIDPPMQGFPAQGLPEAK
jgi:hypothetical protein